MPKNSDTVWQPADAEYKKFFFAFRVCLKEFVLRHFFKHFCQEVFIDDRKVSQEKIFWNKTMYDFAQLPSQARQQWSSEAGKN